MNEKGPKPMLIGFVVADICGYISKFENIPLSTVVGLRIGSRKRVKIMMWGVLERTTMVTSFEQIVE
jgi:hypothetical protein